MSWGRRDNRCVPQYFSSGLAQNGEENEQSGAINGFLLLDIYKELHRGLSIKCTGCKKPGGYVGCAVKACRKAGHFPCLHRLGFTFHYADDFAAYCQKHCPVQPNLPLHDDIQECCICLSTILPKHNLYSPCCLTRFHRECIQVRVGGQEALIVCL